MTEIDKLKELAGAVTMQGDALEITEAIHSLMIVHNISPFTMIRALQMAICEDIALAMVPKSEERFEDLLDSLCESIREHARRIRKVEIERRSKGE
jgi:hypothetical protein